VRTSNASKHSTVQQHGGIETSLRGTYSKHREKTSIEQNTIYQHSILTGYIKSCRVLVAVKHQTYK